MAKRPTSTVRTNEVVTFVRIIELLRAVMRLPNSSKVVSGAMSPDALNESNERLKESPDIRAVSVNVARPDQSKATRA